MNKFVNIADLHDPDDKQGRTYREVNNDKNHIFNRGDFVEVYRGERLFVVKLTRDCDGTPLYNLGSQGGDTLHYGISDESLTKITDKYEVSDNGQ